MIDVFVYDTQARRYLDNPSVAELSTYLSDEKFLLWADFFNPDEEERKLLSTVFQFDEYAIEDCTHPRQIPKLESFADYHFFIVQGMSPPSHSDECGILELDGFLGDRYLVTYHEETLHAVENAKKHLKQHNGRLAQGTAYLAYEILDQVIDMYLPALDYFDEKISQIETMMESEPYFHGAAKTQIKLSTQILNIRRSAVKNQQVFYQFSHSTLQFIDPEEARLFRDIYDHTVRVVDMTEYYQQTLRGALDIQFSMSSSRVNQVVQFLTIFATIMLPLNVITGIYGMNFDWMPLVHHPYGFWMILSLMLAVTLVMLYSFRRRKWL